MFKVKDILGGVPTKQVCLMPSGEQLARNVSANEVTISSQGGTNQATRRDIHQ